jgi:hypothetical protein
VILNISGRKISAATAPVTVPTKLQATSSRLHVRVESKICSISMEAESATPSITVIRAAAPRGNRRIRTSTAVSPRGK